MCLSGSSCLSLSQLMLSREGTHEEEPMGQPFINLVAPRLIKMKLAWTLQAFTLLLVFVPPVTTVEPSYRFRRRMFTSSSANLGLIRCLVPHGRASRCVHSF